jgi:HSP20 family protein
MAYYPAVMRARRAPVAWNDVFGRFDRLFDSDGSNRLSLAWSPVTDVREDENGLNVSVELPGLSTDDVSVSVENGILSISGEKKQVTEEEDSEGIRHLAERRYGSFERTFRLPRGVDSDKVKAKFNNGLLNIDIPKSETAKKKQVEIK